MAGGGVDVTLFHSTRPRKMADVPRVGASLRVDEVLPSGAFEVTLTLHVAPQEMPASTTLTGGGEQLVASAGSDQASEGCGRAPHVDASSQPPITHTTSSGVTLVHSAHVPKDALRGIERQLELSRHAPCGSDGSLSGSRLGVFQCSIADVYIVVCNNVCTKSPHASDVEVAPAIVGKDMIVETAAMDYVGCTCCFLLVHARSARAKESFEAAMGVSIEDPSWLALCSSPQPLAGDASLGPSLQVGSTLPRRTLTLTHPHAHVN